ncbi:PRKR-interacting protein 1 homolog [Diabrotica undecimpunctata]|uniref:PRKR-interacting protein 1 homolog n=1 Tax=Diabrotica undecimpunctata TaxID=50387 RepID=UPI003B63ABF9
MGEENEEKEEPKPIIIRNSTDLQRLKLEKLMKNPEKPVIIPERPKDKGVPNVPDFVRNVMGSSAGAGSGEFHVYRHLRRKEYARQKYMQEKAEKEQLDDEYHQKLEENKKQAEERTEKKRLKRLKKKNAKKRKPNKVQAKEVKESSSEDSGKSEEEDSSEEPPEPKEMSV